MQELASLADSPEPLGIVVDALTDAPQLVARIRQFRGHRAQPGFEPFERPPSRHRRDRRPQRIDRATVVAKRGTCARCRVTMRECTRQLVLLEGEPLVLVGIDELRCGRARRLGTAAGRSRARVLARHRRAPPVRRRSVSTSERASSSAVRSTDPNRSRAARWVAVPSNDWWACWPCRSTSRPPHSASVETGASRPLRYARERPSRGTTRVEHDFVVADHEASFDRRFVGTGTHQHRVGPRAHEQFDRLDHHRLAGPGLTRECRHPR